MTDLGIISSDDYSGADAMQIRDIKHSISLSSEVGGYTEFLKLLNYDHKIVEENGFTLAFTSYVFAREILEDALNNLDNELFKRFVLEDIKEMTGKYFYLYLI